MNVLITGATRGLGRALADHFLADGDRVIAIQRGRRADLAGEPRYLELAADLEDLAALPGLAPAIGPVDLVVHNAVRCEPDPDGGVPAAEVERHVRVNALTPVALSRALAEHAGARSLHHVFLGTRSALEPEPELAAYGVSKLLLGGLVRHLARALAGTPQVVSTIVLGSLATPERLADYEEHLRATIGEARAGDLPPDRRDQARRLLFGRAEPRAAFPDLIPLAAVHRTIRALVDLGPVAHGAIWRLDHGIEARA